MGTPLGIEQFAPPAFPSSGTGRGQSRLGAFPDQRPLELGKRAENVKDQLPARTIGVDALSQAAQTDTLLVADSRRAGSGP